MTAPSCAGRTRTAASPGARLCCEPPSGGVVTLQDAAGATVSGDESALVELSPLVSYQGEGLEAYADKAIQAPIHLEK